MDELVDILDENGVFTGSSVLKSEAHLNGFFHQTVHVWLYTQNKELLLQQRGRNKTTFPLLWDISVAGHIAAGEEVITAALREVEEEIGLLVPKSSLEKIGVNKSQFTHNQFFTDNEFNHVFIAELTMEIAELRMQEEEVEALQLLPIQEYKRQVENQNPDFVPLSSEYLEMLCKAIKERLTS